MNKVLTVVKIGGNVVDNPTALQRFVSDFAALPMPKILIHGGGKEATRLSSALGIETIMLNGRRVTSRQTLDVVTMVYAGLVNKRVVSSLQAAGCNALGLSGADGNAITATKRPAEPVDFGFVGDIATTGVNTSLIQSLLNAGITPVFCAITHDSNGTLLNCNADSVATAVATAMAVITRTELIFCLEKDGVLSDINNPDSLIREINPLIYAELKQSGAVNSGMIPKIDNAFKAINAGVSSVTIKHSDNILNDRGTTIIP